MTTIQTEHTEGVDKNKISIPKPPWEKVDGNSFNADHLIHAYRKGQEKGINDHIKAIQKVTEQNIHRFMDLIDDFINIINDEFNVEFKDSRIKIHQFDDFECIITINKKDYFSDSLDKIYDRLYEYEKVLDVDFEFQIMFTFEDKYTNYEKMSMDGYSYFRKPS